MRILGVLLGAFLGVNKWSNYETKSGYPRELLPSFTPLHESVQEPKLPYSDTKTLPQRLFKSFFPLSILLGAFGLKKSSVADDRVLPTSSISSPANFSFTELRNVIQEGKVFVIKDFIDDDILAGLREDIQALVDSKKFAPSGLSNRAKGRLVSVGVGMDPYYPYCTVLTVM
jgi:hypothetical protein